MSQTNEEVKEMPGRDKTGPAGLGPISGRGMGPCNFGEVAYKRSDHKTVSGFGRGCGRGRGFGRGLGLGIFRRSANNDGSIKTEKTQLQDQKNILKKRIEEIDKQIESI